MNDITSQSRRLALVIDADNAQPSLIQPVLLAAASRGLLRRSQAWRQDPNP